MGSESINKKRVLESRTHNLIMGYNSIIKNRVLGFIIDNLILEPTVDLAWPTLFIFQGGGVKTKNS